MLSHAPAVEVRGQPRARSPCQVVIVIDEGMSRRGHSFGKEPGPRLHRHSTGFNWYRRARTDRATGKAKPSIETMRNLSFDRGVSMMQNSAVAAPVWKNAAEAAQYVRDMPIRMMVQIEGDLGIEMVPRPTAIHASLTQRPRAATRTRPSIDFFTVRQTIYRSARPGPVDVHLHPGAPPRRIAPELHEKSTPSERPRAR